MQPLTKKQIVVLIVIAFVIFVAMGYWFLLQNKKTVTKENLNSALESAIVETPVPPSANAYEQVAAPVNPIEKTNPFKNEYKNPF